MTLVVRQTTLEAIEQGQGRIDNLYCNAMGIVDRLARNVMQSMATDVMESLNNAKGTLEHDLMALRATIVSEAPVEHALAQIDAMLGITFERELADD